MCFLEVDNDGPGPAVRVVDYRPGTLRVSIPGSHRRRNSSSSDSSSCSCSNPGSSSSSSSSSSTTHHKKRSDCHSHDKTAVIVPRPACRPHHSYPVHIRPESPEPAYTTIRRTRVRTRSESFIPDSRRWFPGRGCSPPPPSHRHVEYVSPGSWRSRPHYGGRVLEEVRYVSGRID